MISFIPLTGSDQATVESHQGISLFAYAQPVGEFDVIGRVKVGVSVTNKVSEYLRIMLKKVKKDYPNANGIILSEDLNHADVIHLK